MARPYKYTAEHIEQKFIEYQQYIKDNVMYKPEMIKSGERVGEIVQVPTPVMPEKREFCLFIEVDRYTFDLWLTDETKQNNNKLFDIATRVNDWIQSYQTRAGIVGLANPMLVARINNITETVNVNQPALQPIVINVLNQAMDLKGLYDNNAIDAEIVT